MRREENREAMAEKIKKGLCVGDPSTLGNASRYWRVVESGMPLVLIDSPTNVYSKLGLGEKMKRADVLPPYPPRTCFPAGRATLMLLSMLMWGTVAFTQNTTEPSKLAEPFRTRVTHVLGFEGASNNANGTISLQGGSLQFQKDGGASTQIETASVQHLFLGTESKQVGGLPMTLGKIAAPYGGGRVISLFAHKKYDTLTLEYVDAKGGIHGAIFQLRRGQADILRHELLARGAHVNYHDDETKREGAAEVQHENE